MSIETGNLDYNSALKFVASLDYAESVHWRLMALSEFQEFRELLEHPAEFQLFCNVQPRAYWTSDSSAKEPDHPWAMDLSNGLEDRHEYAARLGVWPVRTLYAYNSQSWVISDAVLSGSRFRFLDLQDRTVYDRETNLILMRDLDDVRKILELRQAGVSPGDEYGIIKELERMPRLRKKI